METTVKKVGTQTLQKAYREMKNRYKDQNSSLCFESIFFSQRALAILSRVKMEEPVQ